MSSPTEWTPPKAIEELFAQTAGNNFASINAPTAGARTVQELPKGSAPLQLYSLATPNGQKVGIILEELAEAGIKEADYDAFVIRLNGEQFTSGFVGVNPNSKIPALVDTKPSDGGEPVNLFESANIVLYLAEKHKFLMPEDSRKKAEVMNWVFWQMAGQGPMTGNFGHFFVYAPADKVEARNYGVARYGMEVLRLSDVLEKHLADGRSYLLGEDYTIADVVVFPWFNTLHRGYAHKSGMTAATFLNVDRFPKLNAWRDRLLARPAVQRGITVCRGTDGVGKPWLADNQKL
ncbi:glutathione S-transferase [Gonapodya prolifera JEL478]|uniref:Glutathione S-transferase n=1 Tax=Gonapodya prolifera (strain JEL478) TaxID=1344416 RepID=A0A139ATY8_GONPJ|nr:glutathione S-transferase [Gonapodya prolifera JEL478]|eukprot:KXS20191.1 glutathione S-transferase [Gonapodya prolifera JEL478]